MSLVAALALLNASLTFVSVWPTLWVVPSLRLSLDAAVLVLGVGLAWHWRQQALGRRVLRGLAIIWVLLIVAHYLESSTRALYGRGVNLYWDLKLLPDVGAMFAYVAQPRILLALAAGLLLVPVLLYVPVRWAIGRVNHAAGSLPVRRVLVLGSALVLLIGIAQRATADLIPQVPFARSVSASIAGEVIEFVAEASGTGRRPLPAPAPVRSDLEYVRGADVIVLFIESYGVTSWERPEFREALAPARTQFLDAIQSTGRRVVTGVVESTTFGGESWLAHISLLSGIEVRDPEVNRRLMAGRRDTMVTPFGRGGYHTLAVMPGILAAWPEGAFYGFDRIYGAPDLAYQGPPFGWWDVTDQFVLARMDEYAIAPPNRRPSFVFLPTISTHAPFTPTPPYQPDWSRVLTATPYDHDELMRAWEEVPDWTNLGPGYARSLAYTLQTVSGYLRLRADRDLVLVMLGDHQPPALVSGEGASWNVPVHVIASRPAVLDRLLARGFRAGLEPGGEVLARMDTLMPILLAAFGNTGPLAVSSTEAARR